MTFSQPLVIPASTLTRARIPGGPQCDPHARLGQEGADALEVGLAAAALGVADVSPAQQQDGANG